MAVLVPDVVPNEKTILIFQEDQLEEFIIFLLGLTGFLIFQWKERQSNAHLEEKLKIQKEAHQITKSLTDTYSYIGETNRKLDIMKNVSINLLDASKINPRKGKKFFDTMVESIYILGKSKKFIIRFINIENKETIEEIKSRKRIFLKASNEEIVKNLIEKDKSFTESKYHFTITSQKSVDKTIVAIVISKNNQQQKLEDPDMLKALASQMLFFHHYMKKTSEEKI